VARRKHRRWQWEPKDGSGDFGVIVEAVTYLPHRAHWRWYEGVTPDSILDVLVFGKIDIMICSSDLKRPLSNFTRWGKWGKTEE